MIYTAGLGELPLGEWQTVLSPASLLIDIRADGPPASPPCEIPVDWRPELAGLCECDGALAKRSADDWLHDHIVHEIPNPWTYHEIYTYQWFTLTTQFNLAIDPLLFDGACFVCDQEDWWLCRRAVLADWLGFHGHDVLHLGRRQWLHKHYLSGRLERYDRRVIQKWEERANG